METVFVFSLPGYPLLRTVFAGTLNVAELSAFNTSIDCSGTTGGLVFSNLSTYNQLELSCPVGDEIDNSTLGQYTCRTCPSALKNTSVILLLS